MNFRFFSNAIIAVVWLALASIAVAAIESAPPQRVAISPIIPPGPDDGLDQGLAFADLLAVRLSGDTRWELVERARLSLIETEWTLKGSLTAGRAEALRIGALARADLVIECTVSDPGLEHPWCRVAVIETARAELLAERKVLLGIRPTGTWYRSPPETDVESIVVATRELLGTAGERLTQWRGQPVAALISSSREAVDKATLDHLAESARLAGFRWLDLVPGAAAEAESLLHLLGYTESTPSPWSVAADVYVWIAPSPEGDPVLHHWRPGLPVRTHALSAPASGAFGAIMQSMQADLDAAASVPSPAERLEVARSFLAKARTLWRTAGFSETTDRFNIAHDFILFYARDKREQLIPIRDLLAAAAFFALEDREIQELRAVFDVAASDEPTKAVMRQRYCTMVDRFWLRPDQRVDWRLYAESFAFPQGYVPASFQKRRMAAGVETLVNLPEELARPFGPMLDDWLRIILMYPEDKDLDLVKKIWPMAVLALGNEMREPGKPGEGQLFTGLLTCPVGWRDDINTLIRTAGPALYQAPAPPRSHPRSGPTERRGLSVQERTPRVLKTVTLGVPGSESWKQTEHLDDGNERIATKSTQSLQTANFPSLPPPNFPSFPPSALPQSISPPPVGASISPIPILAAAQRQDWAEVDRLLAGGADLSVGIATRVSSMRSIQDPPDQAGQALLCLAVTHGRIELAVRLLDTGVVPSNEPDHWVFGSLWTRLGKLNDAELQLYRRLDQAGARVLSDDSYDPFIAFFRRETFRQEFRKREKQMVGPNAAGTSSPGSARRADQVREKEQESIQALKQLIDLGLKDIFGQPAIDRADKDGRTPLVRAILMEWDAGVSALVNAGANLDCGHFQGTPTKRLLNANPRLASLAAGEGSSPATSGQAPDGATMVAALLRGDSTFLAKATLTPEALRYRDAKRWSLLHHAASEKADAFARRLIAAGAPLNVLTSGGQTPLAFAAANRLEGLVEAMLAAGASVNLREGNGPTPLFQAAFSQNPTLVRRLLKAGADHRVRADADMRTVAQVAATRDDNVAVLEVLFEAGADFNALSGERDSVLDWAVSADASKNVPYIYAKGGRWGKWDANELPPLQRAARDGRDQMVRALLDCGEWDEEALGMARSPSVKALLEDAATRRGSKVAEDLVVWPMICADRTNGVGRAEIHLAAGGNVNHARYYGSFQTPLEMALAGMNPELVRYLLAHGAVARARRDGDSSIKPPSLFALRTPLWLTHPKNVPPGYKPPFETTMEAWDAYAAEMIALIAPRWPDPVYSELLVDFEKNKQPRAAATLRAAGVTTY